MARKHVVAIVGDYYHPSPLIEESLKAAFHPLTAEGWTLAFSDIGQLQARLAEKPDIVILFKEDRQTPTEEDVRLWMSESIGDDIRRYVESGGAWLAWHSGLAGYAVPGNYTNLLRGHFDMHPQENKVVQYAPVPHPVTAGLHEFAFIDEHYFVTCDEANTSVFLKSASPDGASIAGWSHPVGDGRVCCLTPAHRREGLLDESFLSLLTRCIQWCGNAL